MATAVARVGPADHRKSMPLKEFIAADFVDGWLYELARGVIVVTEVPGPNHGWIVRRLARLFDQYDLAHPGTIHYLAGGMECRIRLPGMESDRHPDQAIYLTPEPHGRNIWTRWMPDLIVEVVSRGGEDRDYVEKKEEYLRAGVREYWIVDPPRRVMTVCQRAGDTWDEKVVRESGSHRTELLPGLVVRPRELFTSALRKRGRGNGRNA